MLFIKILSLVLLFAIVTWMTSEFVADLNWDNIDKDDDEVE